MESMKIVLSGIPSQRAAIGNEILDEPAVRLS